MENYDFYQQNIGRAENADGSLQKQADIYSESWEAARDRVTASLEEIYQKLLDDGFFIKMLNTLSKVIDGINDIIDNMGGLQGVLSSAGLILTNIFSNQMASGIDKFVFNIRNIAVETGHAFGIFKQFQTEEEKMRAGMGSLGSEIEQAYSSLYDPKGENGFGVLAKQVYDLQDEYNKNSANMSEEQKAYYQQRIKNSEQLFNTLVKQSDVYEQIAEKQKQEEEHLQKVIGAEQERLKTKKERLDVEKENNEIQVKKIDSDLKENEDDLNEAGDYIMNNFDSTNEEHIKQLKKTAKKMALTDDVSWQAWSKNALALVEKNKYLKEQQELHEKNTKKIEEQTTKLEEQQKAFEKIKDLQSGKDTRIQDLKSSYQVQGALTAIKTDLNSDGITGKDAANATADSLNNIIEILPDNNKIKKDVQEMLNTLEIEIKNKHDKIDLSAVMIDGKSFSSRLADVLGTLEEDNNAIYDSLVKDFQASGMSFEAYGKALQEAGLKIEPFKQALEKAGVSVKNLSDEMNKGSKHTFDLGKTLTGTTQAFMSFNTIINTGKGIVETFGDESKTASEKVGALTQGAMTLIPAIQGVAKAFEFAGPWGLAIAAVAVILANLPWDDIIYNLNTTEAERELDNLKASAESLSNTLDETKEKAQALRSTFDEYNDLYDTLQNCTKGTTEWAKALSDVNNKVLDILDKYPELASEITNVNGVLTISQKGQDEYLKKLNESANLLQAAKTNQSLAVKQQQLVVDEEKIAKSISGAIKVSQTEAMKGLPKDLSGEIKEALSDNIDKITLTSLSSQEALTATLSEILRDNTSEDTINRVAEIILDKDNGIKDAIIDLQNDISTNSLAEATAYEAMAMNILTLNGDTANLQHLSDISTNVGKITQKVLEEEVENEAEYQKGLIQDTKNIVESKMAEAANTGNDSLDMSKGEAQAWAFGASIGTHFSYMGKEIENKIESEELDNYRQKIFDYLQSTGVEGVESIDDVHVSRDFFGNIGFNYGNNHKTINLDDLNTYFGTQTANDKIIANALGLDSFISRANTVTTDSSYVSMARSGDLSRARRSDLDSFQNEDDIYKILDVDKNSTGPEDIEAVAAEVYRLTGTNVDFIGDETVTNVKQIVDEFNQFVDDQREKQLATWNSAGESALSWMAQQDKNSFNQLVGENGKDLDTYGKEAIANLINQVYQTEGPQLALNFQKELADINLEGTDFSDFVQILTTIDFSSTTYEDFIKQMELLGKNVPITKTQFESLSSMLDNVANSALRGTEALTTTYKELNDIIKGLKNDDSIKEEDFQKLDPLLQSFFDKQLDGTYRLEDAAGKFQETAHQVLEADFTNEQIALQERRSRLKNAIDNGDLKENSSARQGLEEPPAWLTKYLNGSTELLEAQKKLQLLEDTGTLDTTKRSQLEYALTSGNKEEFHNAINEINDGLTNLSLTEEQAALKLEDWNNQINAIDYMKADAYDNFADLTEAFERGAFSMAAYNQRLIELDQILDTQDLNADELKEYSEYLQEIAGDSAELDDNLESNAEAATIVAKSVMKMNQGVEALASNFEEWNSVLTKSDKTSKEYYDSLSGMRKAMANLLDINEDAVSSDFIVKNLDTIKLAAKGDEKAIDSLREKLQEDVIMHMELDDESMREEIVSTLDKYSNFLKDNTLEIGAELNKESFIEAMNQMILDAGMTADQVNALFDSMGFEATFAEEPQTTTTVIPEYTTFHQRIPGTTVEINGNTYEDGWAERTFTEPTGQHTITGETAAYAMAISTDGKKAVPKIDKITKKASGAFNNSSSSNKGGKSSGSSSSSKRSAEKERYHQVNKERESIESRKSLNSAYQKQTFGQDQINLIKDEQKLIEEQIENTKKHLAEAYGYLKSDTAALMSKGYGFTLDPETGVINNYDAIVDHYRQLFLSGSLSEEAWQEFQKVTKQYEETLKETQDWELKLEEDTIAKHEAKIKEITTEVELKISINEDGLKYLDFLMTMIEDDAFNAAQNIALLGQSLELNMKNIDAYKNGIKEVLGSNGADQATIDKVLSGNYSNDDLLKLGMSDNDIDKIRDYSNNIRELTIDIHQYWSQVYDNMSNDLDEYIDGVDRATKKIEHNMKTADWVKDIVKLAGQAQTGVTNATLDALDQATVQMSQKTLDTLVLEQATINEKLEELRAENRDAMTEEQRKAYDKEVEYFEDQLMSATEAVQNAHKQTLEAINTAFEESMHRAVEAFQNSLNGDNRLDILADSYDKYLDLRDQYLATYEKEYELSKLNRDLQNKIDNTSNLKAKQQLLDMQREITALQESGAQMSKYDLEYLQKKIELQEAQLALEEARNAKSNVALRRNADGGFSYVYTANQEDVANAEQNYEDKLYEMQKLNEQYLDDLQNNIYKLEQAFGDELEALKLQDLSDDLYAKEMQRLLDYYGPKLGIYLTQLDNVCDHTGRSFEDTFVGQNSPVQTSQEYLENFMNQAGILYDESADRVQLWSDSFHEACASVNLDSQNLNDNIQEQFIGEGEDDPDSLVGMSKLAADSAEDLSETYKKAFEDSLGAIKTFQEQYGELIQKVIDQNVGYIGNLNNVIATLAALERQHKATKDAADSGDAGNYIGSASQGDSGSQGVQTQPTSQVSTTPQVAAKDWQVILKETGTVLASNKTEASAQAWIDSNSSKYISANKDLAKHIWYVRRVTPTSTTNSSSTGGITKPITTNTKALFATGGYTGDWGDNGTDLAAGRLAVLHSKELVLNREDTANMLSAVDMVRQIAQVIDLNAIAASQSFITSAIGTASTDNVLQQQVTITAEFPNAVNHSEIEEAFENIVDLASQYANRKYR